MRESTLRTIAMCAIAWTLIVFGVGYFGYCLGYKNGGYAGWRNCCDAMEREVDKAIHR